MKRKHPIHETRAARSRRDLWKKVGIWAFIVFFALSVAGGLIAFTMRPR